ncbi:hypothetical protein IT072_19530 [Leifsonia sp. ZF2019]|uniref:hypothetical protein n=1 Tax=Leifsonia sp. ZF2019 TaxID=2781978 RepID=UPI001CC05435|nr:hypothetical protein [Leifsonia sp. ZF2019]UAJ79353.1 hypothetical protein IT072_19530 [Leifsonia sp. ZF2019]
MKLLIFVAGVAVGFVIGSRAGRGAYDDMRKKLRGFTESAPVQQVKDDVKDFASRAASDIGETVGDAVGKATDKAAATIDDLTGKKSGGAATAS